MTQPQAAPHLPGGRAAAAIRGAIVVAAFTALLWVIEIVDATVPANLDQYGIESRTVDGLAGIAFAPFLHAGFGHLSANTLPLLVLGFLSAARGLGRFAAATVIIVLVSGVGVWFTGPASTTWYPVVTVGASGLIFGYFGYLAGRGVFDRRLLDIVVAVVVVLVYGSLLWGVLPTQEGISWQGHLFGLIGGVIAAFALRRKADHAVSAA